MNISAGYRTAPHNSEHNSGQNSDSNSGQNSNHDPDQNSNHNSGQNSDHKHSQNSSKDPSQNPGHTPSHNPGHAPSNNPNRDPDNNPGHTPGQDPGRIISYFRNENRTLAIITATGIFYNIGMTAAPWFEGRLAQCLCDIFAGTAEYISMVKLASLYVITIFTVQLLRYFKRLYVRKFGNNVNRRMKQVIYSGILEQDKDELKQQVGGVMTRAIADADACAEGMRKFTTEVFDTGVVMISYIVMLLCYDWRLALISMAFPPLAYISAQLLRKTVARSTALYKESAGRLNSAAFERAANAILYRNHGLEKNRDAQYEENLRDYEKSAVKANIRETAPEPIYQIIAMAGIIFVLWLGARNVLGTGWTEWNIAAFTTFVSCFTKLAVKSSKAARLFNAVQKAQVSWQRIKPYMKQSGQISRPGIMKPFTLHAADLRWSFPGQNELFRDVSLTAYPGQIIGITGPVACGKSTLGRIIAGEYTSGGGIRYGDEEACMAMRRAQTGYMGHEPELFSDTIRENILLGTGGDAAPYLEAVCLDREVAGMPDGADTMTGDSGVRLSGGQQARLALARTLYHRRPVLILDDPFSAVDAATEKKIMANIRQMASDSIVIIISHRLSFFPQLDQVIWLGGGSARTADHQTLMQECDEYAELFRLQQEGGGHHEK